MGRPGGRVKATRFEPVRLGLGDRIGQAASIAADGAQEPSAQASKHGPAAKRPVPSFRADMRSERVPGVAALAPPDGRDTSSCWKHASGMTRRAEIQRRTASVQCAGGFPLSLRLAGMTD